ncbi:MAG TPA: hypothetical protein DDZ76_10300 [Xanthomonadales bacterium]|nr:hypothetical protein [Xanthomonadales bacterium]
MAKERAKFESGCAARGIPAERASAIFDLMEKFAEYGFNKSHSAAYALIAYQTAWLKRHHPAEFMAATLSSDMDNTDKVVNFLEESRRLGLRVDPPDVNCSDYLFRADDPRSIRYGLGAIKGVGQAVCQAIVAERGRAGPYRDLLDFCSRLDSGRLNRRVLDALIQAGALDGLGSNRASMSQQLPDVLRATEQLAREREAGQVSLFGSVESSPIRIEPVSIPEWPLDQRLNAERETLGHYLSGHPLDTCRDILSGLVSGHLGELERLLPSGERWGERRRDATIILAGLVCAVRRRGDSTAFAQIDDGHGRVECGFFRDALSQYGELLGRDRILVIEGSLSEDSFSGGYSLRARHAWDFHRLCVDHGTRLLIDLHAQGIETIKAIDAVLRRYRPGATPIRFELGLVGTRGRIDIDARHGVRSDPLLLSELRAVAGVRRVELSLRPPWQG